MRYTKHVVHKQKIRPRQRWVDNINSNFKKKLGIRTRTGFKLTKERSSTIEEKKITQLFVSEDFPPWS
jgi:hypothetical protein